jgi:flagellar biogenesis protein FliO
MTAGILLASAPTSGEATFRAKAVVLVIALILFLTLILERVMPKLPDAPPSGPGREGD